MARLLRWGLAYLGAIFVTGFLLFAAIWVADGFVGEVWAVIMGPLALTPLVGAVFLLPALFADLVLAGSAWDRTAVYAGAGALVTFLMLGAWAWFEGSTGEEDETIGLVVLACLGAVGGALFRVFRGGRA